LTDLRPILHDDAAVFSGSIDGEVSQFDDAAGSYTFIYTELPCVASCEFVIVVNPLYLTARLTARSAKVMLKL
jgi:hypothetical protein